MRVRPDRTTRSSGPLPANRLSRLQPAINVGITGHRACILPAGVMEELEQTVDEVLCGLRDAARRIQQANTATFGSEPVQLCLHTPLASGADQIAAKSAHANGYYVRALLPFAPDEYRKDFAGHELEEFDHALQAADEISAIAGKRADLEGAYVLVGKAVIAAADILVAVWDGGEGNGPGGTAHVVDLALARSVPVIHIAIDREFEKISTRLLVGGDAVRPIAQPLSGLGAYDALLREAMKLAFNARARSHRRAHG